MANSLKHIDPDKIDNLEAIEDCLEDAEKSLAGALDAPDQPSKPERPA